MANFLMSQMDYLFFLHGLSFILLGTVCLALNRKKIRLLPWEFLAYFALSQGLQGWMELYFLDLFSPPELTYLRLGVLLVSSIFLFEFIRRSCADNGGPKWPFWSLLPLLAGALSGLYWREPNTLETTIRFALSLPTAAGASLVLVWRASRAPASSRWGLLGAAFWLACYALSAGLVVPMAAFRPISSVNYQGFLESLGMPVHLFWGVAILGTSVCLWGYHIQSTSREQDSRVFSLRRRFGWYVAGALSLIVALGWGATERMGLWGLDQDLVYGKSAAAYGEAIFMRAVTTARGVAVSLSRSPEVQSIFSGPVPRVTNVSQAALDRRSIVVPGSVCYVLDLNGIVLDATNRNTSESWVGQSFAVRHYFQEALLGRPSESLGMGLLTLLPSFFASHPVFDAKGQVVGVAVIRSLLGNLDLFPENGPDVFFVDADGIVLESPNQRYNSQAAWPLTPEQQKAAEESGRHIAIDFTPLMEQEVKDRAICSIEGRLMVALRHNLPIQGNSLLVLCALNHLHLFRLLAISMTLLVSSGTLAFAFGRKKDTESLWAIQDSQRRYQGLIEGSQNLILLFDTTGRCLAVNTVGIIILGLPEEEIFTRHFLDLLWPESTRADAQKSLNEVLQGKLTRFEALAIPCGERRIDLIVALSPIFDFQDTVERFVCIATDVTDLKRTEHALRASEERFRDIALNMGDWVFELDENQVYTYCSPRIWDILGYKPEELIGKPAFSTQTLEYALQLREKLKTIWADHSSAFDLVENIVHRDGSTCILVFNLLPHFDEMGNFRGIRGVVKDVTRFRRAQEERFELERRLLQSQKLDSLSVMAGSIAHNFNNLMQVVLGNHDLVLRQSQEDSKIVSFLKEANKAAQRASELSTLMLTYVGQSGGVSIPLNLNTLATGMDAVITGMLPQQIDFALKLEPDLPQILGDPAQVQQIILNLITNSIEAIGPQSGVITLTTGVVECDTSYLWKTYLGENLEAGSYIFLEIGDTGPGMDAETAARIFDPFFTTRFTGRGLGLPAVVGIMRTHRGALALDTAPGQGARMRVLFPTAPVSTPVPKPEIPSPTSSGLTPPAPSGPFTVLVVDDDPGVLEVAGEVIRSVLEYEVLLAENGHKALNLLKKSGQTVSCVLLDMTMPEMSGIEVLKEIRHILPDLPVIMVSGYLEEEVSASLAGLEIQGFLQKPFSMSKLGQILESLRQNGKPLTP
jgi:PAS domain S-box-containing protein